MDLGRHVPFAPARRVLEVLIAAAPLGATLAAPRLGTPEAPLSSGLPELVLCGLLIAVALVLRHRHPVVAVVTCTVLSTGAVLLLGSPTALVLSVFVALFSAAVRVPLRPVVLLWAFASVLQLGGDLATGGWDQRVLAPLALLVASAAAGVALRQQRIALTSAHERAEIAERTREQEAAARVAEERLRIARELHDVVAHHVAVMGVQAGVASHLMEADPVQARTALAQVRSAGRTAISELGTLVGLLRSDADEGLAAPAPGLAQLPQLIETLRSSGLEVRTSAGLAAGQSGLDEISDITAYRIVQESLTNALRHGTGGVDLQVESTALGVQIRVSNEAPTTRVPAPASAVRVTGGHGLVGMRERAALVGAEVSAGPTGDGRFEVRAHLSRRAS